MLKGESIPPKHLEDAYYKDAVRVFGPGSHPGYYFEKFVGYMNRAYNDGRMAGIKEERARRRRSDRKRKKESR